MTHAELIVRTLLEDLPSIRGEYWIIDGSVVFADGDVGDVNHEAYAVDHARRTILDHFGGDSDDEYIDDDTLRDGVLAGLEEDGIPFDPQDWYPAAKQALSADPKAEKMIKTLNCALGQGDARIIAVQYWGWQWCRRNSISTWTFNADDRRHIISGINDIIMSEGTGEDVWDGVEIIVSVESTGDRHSLTVAELESGRVPSTDPSWGAPNRLRGGPDRVRESDDMMSYMAPEIDRLTSKRMLKVGEEVSHGTFYMPDLVRAGLAKLKEIDYTGHKNFVAFNREQLGLLDRLSELEGEEAVDANEEVERIWDALVETFDYHYVPYGTFFGSNAGSGSCYGCWPAEDYLEECVEEGSIVKWLKDERAFPEKRSTTNGKMCWAVSSGHQALYDKNGNLLWKY